MLVNWKKNAWTGGSFLAQITNTVNPLYFIVAQHGEVMSTEQPCDLAYELADGHLNLRNYPQGFPKPGGIFVILVNISTVIIVSYECDGVRRTSLPS